MLLRINAQLISEHLNRPKKMGQIFTPSEQESYTAKACRNGSCAPNWLPHILPLGLARCSRACSSPNLSAIGRTSRVPGVGDKEHTYGGGTTVHSHSQHTKRQTNATRVAFAAEPQYTSPEACAKVASLQRSEPSQSSLSVSPAAGGHTDR